MKKLLSILCMSALLMASCGDDDDYTGNDGNGDGNLPDVTYNADDFIQELKNNALNTFDINTSELPKTVTLAGGVKITIPADVLTKGGVPVTGAFTLEVYEMLKASDIIFSGTNTNYLGGRILESDGFVYVNAKQNGVILDASLSGFITIAIPTDKADGTSTELWEGKETKVNGEDQFAWDDPEEEALDWSQEMGRSVIAVDGYFEFKFGKLGWCNCDIYWGDGMTLTTVTVNLTGNVGSLASYLGGNGNTFVFFLAKGGPLVVAQLYTPVNSTTVKSYDNSMPVGATGKMIAFSIKEGVFSYASQDITITEDMELTLDLKEVTKEALTANLKALDSI